MMSHTMLRAASAASAIALAIATLGAQPPADTGDKPHRTVRDQIYATSQAERGKALFDAQCSTCHDGGMGPSVTSEGFLSSWENKPARSLYSRILTTMPSDEPGSLSERQVLDVVAFILNANGFPAGEKEIQSANELNDVLMVRSK